MSAATVFLTIGHSTRPLDAFIALLRESDVRRVADVRTVPRSRTNPQYNRDTLPESLAADGIGYMHMPALGGLRPRDPSTPADVNGYWDNASFHHYADYALSPAFAAGLLALRDAGHASRCAIMCAEAVWWRCHRRIVSDYLLASGESVFHIMGPGNVEPALLNPAARARDGVLVYPRTDPA